MQSTTPQHSIMTAMSTPSPSASGSVGQASSSSRRPPRKSTLTQQQKNQKRQRATQEQLLTLEMEFNNNPTPTAIVRERIAQEINMTERSVQIWFQNRRAKIKNIAKKSIESGEDCNDIPDAMRRYLALQAMESGKTLGRDFMARTGGMCYGNGMLLNTETGSSKVAIQHFACQSLSVGSWRRVGQKTMDLVIFYSPEKCCVTYYINSELGSFKIEYPFSSIKNISLDYGDAQGPDDAPQRPPGIVVELTRPPSFFMDNSGSGGFVQCPDFTQDEQVSRVLIHHLGGQPKVLSGPLASLVSLESFQNRHNYYDPNLILAMSAPVSPVVPPTYHESSIDLPHDLPHGLPPTYSAQRGHKRQRSRSVPVAMDVSMLRQHPMQPFVIPPPPHTPYPQSPYYHHPQELYPPVPQHNMPAAVGPALSIDTSTGGGYGMDFRQYSMSATTANSPSEHETPSFYTPYALSEHMPSATWSAHAYLSPNPDQLSSMSHHSLSPMSAMSPGGDPIIANQSPPLASLGRASSADFYPMSQEGAMPDDGMSYHGIYAKEPLPMPFRSPMDNDDLELEMSNIVPFGAMGPASLSPEQQQIQQHQQHQLQQQLRH